MNNPTTSFYLLLVCTFLLLTNHTLSAQEATPPPAATAEELAKKLANPIANLISLPIQGNVDVGIGAYNGSKLVVNVQPVIPITLSPKLNLITRWILPIVSQFDITGENTQQGGLGDAVITGFLSPSQSSLTWGVGPAILVPTATEAVLGGEKFGLGPSVVALKQSGPWTYGALINHLFTVSGNEDRDDVNASFFNPFASYNWKSGAGITGTLEYTQDWEHDVSVVVAHAMFSGVTKFGGQTVSLAIGPRIHFAPDNHPAYGLRAAITMVFPK
jgi:hypothetical protein